MRGQGYSTLGDQKMYYGDVIHWYFLFYFDFFFGGGGVGGGDTNFVHASSSWV